MNPTFSFALFNHLNQMCLKAENRPLYLSYVQGYFAMNRNDDGLLHIDVKLGNETIHTQKIDGQTLKGEFNIYEFKKRVFCKDHKWKALPEGMAYNGSCFICEVCGLED